MRQRSIIGAALVSLAVVMSVTISSAKVSEEEQAGMQDRFEAWARASNDDDGDGVPNGIDLCPGTRNMLIRLHRALPDEEGRLDDESKPTIVGNISSDFVVPNYYAHMRYLNYSSDTAELRFIEGVEGKHKDGTECIRPPYSLRAMKGEHNRIRCTDRMIVMFDADADTIFASIHPLVMIPVEWLDDQARDNYTVDNFIYTHVGQGPANNAYDLGIPAGCAIDFPIKEWSLPK